MPKKCFDERECPYRELCKEAIELFGRMGGEFTGGKGGVFRFVANWLKEKTEYLEESQG